MITSLIIEENFTEVDLRFVDNIKFSGENQHMESN